MSLLHNIHKRFVEYEERNGVRPGYATISRADKDQLILECREMLGTKPKDMYGICDVITFEDVKIVSHFFLSKGEMIINKPLPKWQPNPYSKESVEGLVEL